MKTDKLMGWCTMASMYIRFKPDREAVKQELYWHMTDKYDDLKASGMTDEEAEMITVNAMGDVHEVGKALDSIHKPYLGWIWVASKVFLEVTLALFLLLGIFGGYVSELPHVFMINNSKPMDQYYETLNDEGATIILPQTESRAKSGGYTFTIIRAAQQHQEGLSLEEDDRGDMLFFTLRAYNPKPWAGYPNGALYYMTALDSNGNSYTNALKRGKHSVVGNTGKRGLLYYDLEMWVEGLDPSAEWIELQYDRFGRTFTLRMDLAGGEIP